MIFININSLLYVTSTLDKQFSEKKSYSVTRQVFNTSDWFMKKKWAQLKADAHITRL